MSTSTPTSTRTTIDAAWVTAAGPESRPAVADVLAAAFASDPVFTWVEPDPAALGPVLPMFFEAFARAYSRNRLPDLAVLDGGPAGAALWVPPGIEPVHPDDAWILERAMGAFGADAQERAAACSAAFVAVHPEEPAWYLNFLGVSPDRQGRGVGSTLLRSVLAACDVRGEPAYLEATSERNRALYERHGFRVRDTIPLPDGPTVHAMWRNPVMPPRPPWPREAP